MNNKSIQNNLSLKKTKCLAALNSNENLDPLFKEILEKIIGFDFENYKRNLEVEILANLKNWWSNSEKGIKKEEELYAILFEYDYFFKKDVNATAYGIGEWRDYKVQADKFNMGFDYDFTSEFYAHPGIQLNFFDSLESLDPNNLPERFEEENIDLDELLKREPIKLEDYNDEDNNIELVEGYDEIIALHKYEGMLAIHDVLVKIDADNGFESLNYKDDFMFIINEHDSGEVYPLLIKKR